MSGYHQVLREDDSESKGLGLGIGLGCSAISRMGGVPAAFSGGWMMLNSLYLYCYDSRFSGCTILLL